MKYSNLKNIIKFEILKVLKEDLNQNISYLREVISSGKISNPEEVLEVIKSGDVELDYFLEHIGSLEYENMILNLAYFAYSSNSDEILDKVRTHVKSDKFEFIYNLFANENFQYINSYKVSKDVNVENHQVLTELKFVDKELEMDLSTIYWDIDSDRIFGHEVKKFQNVNFSNFDIFEEILKLVR